MIIRNARIALWHWLGAVAPTISSGQVAAARPGRPQGLVSDEMNNPWLGVSEADYVGHMNSPAVGQRPVLGRLLGEALGTVKPHVLLVLGCSTGNGFEHINPVVTSRVVAVDVSPEYLRHLHERFPNPTFELDVRCGDLKEIELEGDAYDMVPARRGPERRPAGAVSVEPGGDPHAVYQLAEAGVTVSLCRTRGAR